jgi:hypothetical protein
MATAAKTCTISYCHTPPPPPLVYHQTTDIVRWYHKTEPKSWSPHCTMNIWLYRVSQEEWTKFQESVPYVKIYRYNPKHLYPKLNGYEDNGQRKVWTSLWSTHWDTLYIYHDIVCFSCNRESVCFILINLTYRPKDVRSSYIQSSTLNGKWAKCHLKVIICFKISKNTEQGNILIL